MTDPAQPNGLVGTIFLISFIAFALAMRFRRMRRGRRLRLAWLWVVPLLVGSIAGALLYFAPPSPFGWAVCALALGIGALLGWQRARLVDVTIDPDSHQLSQRESPLAMLFILLIIAIRLAIRRYGGAEAEAWQLNALVISDALVVMAFGLLATQRLVLWQRGRALLMAARGG